MAGLSAPASRGLTSHLVGRAVLQRAAELLSARGIALMPLKGVWMQQFAYEGPAARPITDVDVLVRETDYDAAVATLRAAGWQLRAANASESAYLPPDWPLPLDLHKRLFTRCAYRMPTAELFARGRRDAASFNAALVLPDPRDVLAHAVGHFVKSRASAAAAELQDIPRLADRCRLEPESCALHLTRCGMARAARFVLPLTAAYAEGCFAAQLLAALSPDPLGSALVKAMRALRAKFGDESRLRALPGFALDASLPRGALAFALRAYDRRFDYAAHSGA